ncbi:MAG TPA: outer-membrane lipoprotein carrier protein LolA [Candidatus Acidoferrum sp.]|nr:outer-membrane lipoprotein carrier protein LolA [Candidatus Acidoferrum sp.]
MAAILCAVALFFFPPENHEAASLAARMEARYRSAKTLQATFLERYSENGSVLRAESGIAYFRRSGKMRWEYERPERNLFLVDGKSAWFYVPTDHTVTRVPAKQSGDLRTPLALLAGQMKISRICARVEFAEGEKPLQEGDAVLHCRVRAQKQSRGSRESENALEVSESDEIVFEVVRDSGELTRLIVRQAGAVEVEFRFENWRFDPAIPESMFRFEPPAGVAIVNGESADEKTPSN